MDRFEAIQDILSLRVMGSAVGLLALLFLVVAPRQRLKVFLALAIVNSTLSKLIELEYYADMAKAFFPLFFGYVALAAWFHPGPKRRLPWACWVLPVLAVVSFFYIRNVLDFQLAFILRAQWLIITVAGFCIVRTVHNQASLRYLLETLLLGMFGGVLLTGSQLVVNPSHAFSMGFGRFSPYGVNPNQIGLLFAMSIPVSLYLCVTAKSNGARLGCLVVMGLAALQSALTLSRASMFIAALPSLPIIFVLCRHPGVVILGMVGAYFVGSQVVGGMEGFDLEHMATDAIHQRFDHTLHLLELVEQRPMFGLMYAQYEHSVPEDINAHNAYADLLYLGGLSLALPHFALFLFGHFSAWLTWASRRASGFDPLAISMLAMFSICFLLHGFINGTILYPTYTWALLHVIVLTFFVATGLRLAMLVSAQQQHVRALHRGVRPRLSQLPQPRARGPVPQQLVGGRSEKRSPPAGSLQQPAARPRRKAA